MVECNDRKCPKHGEISVRGNIFSGVVVSAKPEKTAIVERTLISFVPKYERYRKSKSRIYAHNPDCIGAKENDIVKVGETRKLSKTKSFVVLSIEGKKKTIKVEEDTLKEKEEKEEEKKEEEEKKPVKEEQAREEKKAGEEEKEEAEKKDVKEEAVKEEAAEEKEEADKKKEDKREEEKGKEEPEGKEKEEEK